MPPPRGKVKKRKKKKKKKVLALKVAEPSSKATGVGPKSK
jgi:hypothetical protein